MTAGSPTAVRAKRIVTFGEAMLRLTAPAGLRIHQADSLECHVAGSEANVAAALARLGVPVAWVSAVPQSPAGDRVMAELAAAGVDLASVTRLGNARLGLFFVEQGGAPRGSRVWYDRNHSAFTQLTALPSGALNDASFAVVSGITPALGQGSRRLVQAFVSAARSAGARLCVDVNYRGLLWSSEEARPVLGELIAAAQIVVCSERDASTVFGIEDAGVQAARSLARDWAPRAELVVLTRGEQGGVMLAGDRVIEQPAFPTDVLDRFGAGDAFLAGLLWALWDDEDHAVAMRAAAMLAALNCTIRGDLARFSAEELRGALRRTNEAAIRR
jgi:2-dehydro-3-deoxygluconokinase